MLKNKLNIKNKPLCLFNEKQLEAINSTYSKNIILAGPGTGKTQIVSGIIQKLKKDGIDDENIQLITFTNSGVDAMKDRINSIEGKNSIGIDTFHGFCNKIINENKDLLKERIDFSSNYLLDDFESIYLIKDIYDSEYLSLDKLRSGDKTYYLNFIKSEISNLKIKGIGVDEYLEYIEKQKEEQILDEKNRIGKTGKPLKPRDSELKKIDEKYLKLKEFAIIYKKFEEKKKEIKKIDFNDIISLTIDLLKSPTICQKYHDQFQYFIIDEYQDTNDNQNKLIELINPNKLFLIGDEKQSIFSFQGANPKYILDKEKDENFNNIKLIDNYRSSQNILDFANNFYNYNLNNQVGIESNVELKSNIINDEKVKIITFKNELDELTGISLKIKEMIKSNNIKPEEIAIIYRKNKNGEEISNELEKLNIDFNISLGQNIYDNPLINKILYLTNYIFLNKFDNNFTLKKNLYKIANLFDKNQETIDEFFLEIKDIKDEEIFNVIFDNNAIKDRQLNLEKYKNIINGLKFIIDYQKNKKDNEKLSTFINKIQLNNYSFENNIDKKIQLGNIKLLVEFIQSIEKNGGDYQEIIDKYNLAKNIDYKIGDNKVGNSGVNLLTVHKSKGLEFKTVFAIKNIKGQWDGTRNMNSLSEKKDYTLEEINLQYVAFTRAKTNLYITNHLTNKGFNPYLDSYIESEKNKNIFEKIEVDKEFNDINDKVLKLKEKGEFYKKLSNKFLEKASISYSFLNQYFINPKNIIERYFLGIENKPTEATTFGSIIHKIIEKRNTLEKKGETQNEIINEIKEYYNDILNKSSLTINEKDDILNKINSFVDQFLFEYDQDQLSELKLEGRLNFKDDKFINIQGYVDAIRVIKEDDKNIYISLIDYKTGALKSTNALMLPNEYNYIGMAAQLFFYKVLVNLNLDFIKSKLKTNKNIIIDHGAFVYIDKNKGFIEKVIDLKDNDYVDMHHELETLYDNLKKGLF